MNPHAGILQLDYVMALAVQYLETKTAESTMANGFLVLKWQEL
ncbi:hypothetical protein [Lysinibacillus sphaericus]|nr:hypothetical protein [Lysinibacillus sphaericus]